MFTGTNPITNNESLVKEARKQLKIAKNSWSKEEA